jgi:hypothetical protein
VNFLCSSYDEDEDFEEMLAVCREERAYMDDSYVVLNMTLEVKWKSPMFLIWTSVRVCSTCFARLGSTVTDRTGTDRPTSSSQTRWRSSPILRRDLMLDHQPPTLDLDQ